MALEDRIAALEAYARDVDEDLVELRAAHRSLASEHFALRIMFLAITRAAPIPTAVVQLATTVAMDSANTEMERAGIDDEFQRCVRATLDSLTVALTSGLSRPAEGNNS